MKVTRASQQFRDSSQTAFPLADLETALKIDQFDFAMEVSREAGTHRIRKVSL